ncbi:hypothetical protein LTS10_009860 [Elasticomyces elasticus]|nr:hypothetical protein LTS10_009860 [Elasticomyces elasticus]
MAETAKPLSIYQPLDASKREIRILHLLPAPYLEDPICMELKTVSLIDQPYYEALSYAWGDAKDTTDVWIRIHHSTCQDALAPMTSWSAVGSEVPPRSIEVRVTVTLAGALRRLRFDDRIRVVWADAICIDQGNILEKNEQVGMMGDIYQEADHVKIWLGEDQSPHTKRWRNPCILGYGRQKDQDDDVRQEPPRDWQTTCMTEYRNDVKFVRKERNQRNANSKVEVYSEVEAIVIQALYDLLSRPWFTRLWVVQEVSLAKRAYFIVGTSMLPFPCVVLSEERLRGFGRGFEMKGQFDLWDIIARGQEWSEDMKKAVRLLGLVTRLSKKTSKQQQTDEDLIRKVADIKGELHRYFIAKGVQPPSDITTDALLPSLPIPPHPDSLMILSDCGDLDCTDPRDRVYALLSTIGMRRHVKVDYAKTMEEVCIDIAAALSHTDGDLFRILHCASLYPSVEMSTPSWVPDWRTDKLKTRSLDVPKWYNASTIRNAPICIVGNSRLTAKALFVDRVATYLPAPVPSQELALSDNILDLRNYDFEERLLPMRQWLGDIPYEILWRVWLQDSWTRDHLRLSTYDCARLENVFQQMLDGKVPDPKLARELIEEASFDIYGDIQRPCRTESRHVGSTVGMRGDVGDEIYIVAGCPMPILLRPVPSQHGPKQFRFVGLCYLLGFMDGEAVSEALRIQHKEEPIDVFEDITLV